MYDRLVIAILCSRLHLLEAPSHLCFIFPAHDVNQWKIDDLYIMLDGEGNAKITSLGARVPFSNDE